MNPTPTPDSLALAETPRRDPLGLLDHSRGFAVILLSPEGTVLRWNVGAEMLLRYRRDEIVGKHFSTLFRPEDRANGMPDRELQHARTAEVASDENWLLRQDGTVFWASGATTALRDADGVLQGFAKMVRDASERKQLRAALSASEEKFQTTVSQIKDHAIFSTNGDGLIMTWNAGCEHVLGYTANEAIGSDVRGLLDLEGVVSPKAQQELHSAAQQGAYFVERPILKKGGERFWASVITTAVHDGHHALQGFTIVLRDLTERRQADDAVRSSIQRLQLISDTARNLLLTKDPLALLDRVYEQLVGPFELDFYFHFSGNTPEDLHLRAYRGVDTSVAESIRLLGTAPAICRAAASNRLPTVLNNAPESTNPLAEFVRQLGVTAYACFPLLADGKLWGTLSFATHRKPRFDADVVEVFATVAHLFSEAIARSAMTAELAAREAQLGAVLEGAPSGLLMLNVRGAIVMANAHAELLFGYTRAELLTLPCEQLLTADNAPLLESVRGSVSSATNANSGPQRHEVTARRRDGSQFPAEAWLNFTGETDHRFAIIAFVDITARKQDERTLRESERKLQFLNELGEATRELRDPAQIMGVIARAVCEHLDATRCAYADVAADGDLFTIPQDFSRNTPSSVGTYRLSAFGARAVEQLRKSETLVIRNVAEELNEETGAPAFNAIQIQSIICCPLVKEGRLAAMMAVHDSKPRDWTSSEVALMQTVVERCWAIIERARAEQALRLNEERLQLAMEAGRLGMWHYDVRTQIATMDERVAGFYALPQENAVATIDQVFERIHPEDKPRVADALERSSKQGAHYDVEFRILMPDGSVRWIAGKGDAFRDREGNFTQLIGVNYDLTSRKRAEEELHAAQAALQRHASDLEAAVTERTAKLRETVSELERFSYSLSHDMRAPLRAMQGFSQILEHEYGSRLDTEGRSYLKRISAAAHRLDQLIRDVLSYTHVVREEVKLQPIEITPLLRQLISENPALQPPQAEIVVDRPLLPVLGHEAYLTQCLTNLLSNAVKFVPAGTTPRVTIWTEARDDGVRLYVKDNGIGIPKDWQTRIFGMFERMHPASHYDGTGIGLTIVRKAAERMGGQVGLESEPREGSTFWIQLRRP